MKPLRPLVALLLLVALPGVLLEGVWLRGETPYPVGALETTLPWKRIGGDARVQNPSMSDAVLQFIPWDITLRREWRGVLPPAWNPYEGVGAPLAANPQARTLDPIRLAALPWDARRAPGVRIWIALVIAGWLMFGFVRSLGVGVTAALLGAVAYQLGGYVVPWFEHPTGHVAAYLPGVVWAGDAWLRGGRRRAFTGLAIVYALQFYAGHPETTLHLTTVAALFWVVRGWRAGFRRWAMLAAGLCVGGLLAGPVLLPFLEYLRSSDALSGRSHSGLISLNQPAAAATFVVPRLFGWPLTGDWTLPVEALASVAYVGLAPWLLVPLAFLRRHRSGAIAAAVAGVGCGYLAFGLPGASALLEHLPGYAIAPNHRLVMGVAFAGATLGALGLDALARHVTAGRRPGRGVVVAALVLSATVALAWFWSDAGRRAATRGVDPRWVVATALGAIATVTIVGIGRRWIGPHWRWAVVALLVLDLRLAWAGFHATAPLAEVLPPTAATDVIFDRIAGGQRVLTLSIPGGPAVLPPNVSQAFGFADVKQYDALGVPAVKRAIHGAIYSVRVAGLASDFLGILGAKWVAVGVPFAAFQTAAVVDVGAPHLVFFPDAAQPVSIDVLSASLGPADLPAGTEVATLTLQDEHGGRHAFPLRLGRETGHAGDVSDPRVLQTVRERGADGVFGVRAVFNARLAWDEDWGRPRAADVRAIHGRIRIDGIGFVDATGRTSLTTDPKAIEVDGIYLRPHDTAWPRAFVLSGERPETFEDAATARRRIRPAEIERYSTDEVRISADVKAGEYVVLTDAHYPGWRASVIRDDGEESVEIEPAFEIFRCVRANETGTIAIRMVYRPLSLMIGYACALLGIIVLIVTGRLRAKRFIVSNEDEA